MIGGDLSAILDALDEPVLLLNAGSTVVQSNVAARELLGDRLAGQPFVRVMRQPGALGCVDKVMEGASKAQATIRLVGAHNQTYRLTAVALDGVDATIALTLRDVTPLLQAAQQRSDFVANVSHELRSPLTTLTGIIETLQGPARDDAEAQARFLETMQREAGRMNRLIDDLLSLSRVEEDERVRPTGNVDVMALIKATVDLITSREDDARIIDINSVFDKALVTGDGDQLQQVVLNLLENALRYSEGDVAITVEHHETMPRFAGAVWTVRVADTGDGIAPEHLPRLTERFYRVDSGRSRAKGGTGLGLAICKHIVNRHRGRMDVTSTVGKGTSISVLLPAA